MPRYRLRSVRTLDPAVLTESRRDQIALLQSKVTLSRDFMTLTLVQSVAGKLDELRQQIASDADPVLARLENDEAAALGCARCSNGSSNQVAGSEARELAGAAQGTPSSIPNEGKTTPPVRFAAHVRPRGLGDIRRPSPGPGLDAGALR